MHVLLWRLNPFRVDFTSEVNLCATESPLLRAEFTRSQQNHQQSAIKASLARLQEPLHSSAPSFTLPYISWSLPHVMHQPQPLSGPMYHSPGLLSSFFCCISQGLSSERYISSSPYEHLQGQARQKLWSRQKESTELQKAIMLYFTSCLVTFTLTLPLFC